MVGRSEERGHLVDLCVDGGKYNDRLQIFTVFRVVTPCGLVVGYHRFGGLYCLHLQYKASQRRR